MMLTRGMGRRLLLGTATALAAPRLAGAQAPTSIKFTLPWLAQGATAYAYIAREMGAFQKRGITAEISRGFGSVAAAQAIAQGQFEFGLVGAGPLILAAARGLPVTGLATVNYDMTMGIALRADSPIRDARELAGKKIGAVPTSAEFPFWPAFAKRVGIDTSSVTIVQMDNRVLERALIDKQVDAITAVGSSSIPVMQAQGAPHRFLLYSAAGIPFYANVVTTRQDVLRDKPQLCEAVTDALLEATAFQLKEPERALEMFVKQVPELGLTQGGRENARLSQGLMQWTMLSPEAIEHGLGWTDMDKWRAMTDLVMEYGVPADTKRPDQDAVVSNRFAGRMKLPAAEWASLREKLEPMGKLLG